MTDKSPSANELAKEDGLQVSGRIGSYRRTVIQNGQVVEDKILGDTNTSVIPDKAFDHQVEEADLIQEAKSLQNHLIRIHQLEKSLRGKRKETKHKIQTEIDQLKIQVEQITDATNLTPGGTKIGDSFSYGEFIEDGLEEYYALEGNSDQSSVLDLVYVTKPAIQGEYNATILKGELSFKDPKEV